MTPKTRLWTLLALLAAVAVASLFFRRVMLSGHDKIKTLLFNSQAVSKWIKDNSELLHGAISVT